MSNLERYSDMVAGGAGYQKVSTSSARSVAENVGGTRSETRMMPLKSSPKSPDGSSTHTAAATKNELSASEARKFMAMGIEADLKQRSLSLVKAMDDLKVYLVSHGTTLTEVGLAPLMSEVVDGCAGIRAAMEVREQYRRNGE